MTSISHEDEQRIWNWNKDPPETFNLCVQNLITECARNYPNDQAVCSWDGEFTNGQLDLFSSRVAHHLVARGVGPEVYVPIMMEKTKFAVVAMLAVLKAGGAFVFLDPTQPIARLKYLVTAVNAKLGISSMKYATFCIEVVDTVLTIDENSLDAIHEENNTQLPSADPKSAAYLIFTSGSTGNPKGVVIEHRALATSALKGGKDLGLSPSSRVFQFSNYTFDLTIMDVLFTLVHRGCVCIPSETERMNDIVGAMNRLRVTTAWFTPSLLSNLRIEGIKTLRTIIVGGEAVPEQLVKIWSSKFKVIIGYGPSEACVICCTQDTSLPDYQPASGNIGKANTGRAWISEADDWNSLAPIGEVGELLIEGAVLARGYLDDDEKSNKAFVRNPKWRKGEGQVRLYRTGDLVRYVEDGSIRFMGRIDLQVKLRGHRIELGEVEHQIRNSILPATGVVEVVVEILSPAGNSSTPTLTAFLRTDGGVDSLGYLDWYDKEDPSIVTSEDEKLSFSETVEEIRERLIKVLPSYEVPSLYIPLLRIPRSNSDKVDRKKLREIAGYFSLAELAGLAHASNGTAPSSQKLESSEELNLRSLWASVLAIEPSEILSDTNFLWIGGDSVGAIGLVAAARAIGLSLTVETVFRYPVLRDMAQQMGKYPDNSEQQTQIPAFALIRPEQTLLDDLSNRCGIMREQIEDIYPCSPMQQGLIALSIKEIGSYVMRLVYALPDTVNLERFHDAWQKVSVDNPILRTRFFESGSQGLLQVVTDEPLQWQVLESITLEEFLSKDKTVGVQIGQAMSRFAVLRSEDGKLEFVWTVHHAVIDGWSLAEVVERVERTYFEQKIAPSPGFNIFINYLSTVDKNSSRDFWAKELADAPAPTFPRFPTSSYRPFGNCSKQYTIASERTPRSNFTTATIIKTAWSVLIGMLSNSSDVVTGLTLSGRTARLPGIEHIIGPTITTVPFRTKLETRQAVMELLQKIQDGYLEMIPFEQLGLPEIRNISKESKTACDFRTILIIQSAQEAITSAFTPSLLSVKQDTSLTLDYALTMECELHPNHVAMKATYDANVLDGVQIERIFKQLEHLIKQISVEDPAMKISDLQQISPSDLNQIFQWNANIPQPSKNCIHHLIRYQTLLQPEATAVISWDGEMSYSRLDQTASVLANFLIQCHGLGPEVYVPIMMEKSIWAVVAMLAVLKAGAACVPLDIKHPRKRLSAILGNLEEYKSSVLLTSATQVATQGALLESLTQTILAVDVNLIEKIRSTTLSSPEIPPRENPSTPAFVIFTSGSTGTPKGIVLEHSAVCTSIREHGAMIKLNRQSRVLQFSSFTFDISFSELWATLIHGGVICMPSEHDRMNNLAGTIRAMNVNQVSITPTVASHLVPDEVPSLKVLVCLGEALTREVVELWADRVSLINMYGPSEASIYCIGKPDVKKSDNPSNIGHGVGARVWIADPNDSNCLVPIGAVGELLIEGPTLARGYLNNQEQTKAAFIEDPQWTNIRNENVEAPRRFYKTGDLGHYNSDGSISFVGRNDNQIKLRGQRLELGEVEFQLRECLPSHVDVVALVVKPIQGQPILAAFIGVHTSNSTKDPLEQEKIATSSEDLNVLESLTTGLTSKLSAVLPSYMVPSLFIPVTKIPLSTSQKVDRKSLQKMASELTFEQIATFSATKTKHVSPSTPLELKLCNLWASLFKVSNIGKEDNFFQLGDSISAMRLVAAARKEGISLTVDQIFKYPTLSAMSMVAQENVVDEIIEVVPFSLIEEAYRADILKEAITQCSVKKEEIEDIYPVTGQQAYWIHAGINTQEHQVQTVYRLPSSIDLNRFRAAWEAVQREHVILRTRMIRVGSEYIQVVVKPGIKWRTETSLERYLKSDHPSLIGLGEPLQRLCIIHDETLKDKYFVLTMQHCTYDGWSLYLMWQDLGVTYRQGHSKASGAQFNQFIKLMTDIDLSAGRRFWESHVANSISKPLFDISSDHTIFPNSMISRKIKLSKDKGSTITISTMIEVAWSIVFARHLKCPDVIFDILRAGRTTPLPGINDMIAPTTTAIPLRIHYDPLQKIQEVLIHVQRQLSEMTKFEHMGWNEISNLNDELSTACKNSIRINIAPPVGENSDENQLDLPHIWTNLKLALPLRIDCEIHDYGLYVEVVFDKELISAERVDRLFRQFELALRGILVADQEQLLGDIELEGELEGESEFLESIEDLSERVHRIMLTPEEELSQELKGGQQTGSFIVGSW